MTCQAVAHLRSLKGAAEPYLDFFCPLYPSNYLCTLGFDTSCKKKNGERSATEFNKLLDIGTSLWTHGLILRSQIEGKQGKFRTTNEPSIKSPPQTSWRHMNLCAVMGPGELSESRDFPKTAAFCCPCVAVGIAG